MHGAGDYQTLLSVSSPALRRAPEGSEMCGIERIIQKYTDRRLRRWLMQLRGKRGTGYRQYPDEYLYETLGLYQRPSSRAAVAKAKA